MLKLVQQFSTNEMMGFDNSFFVHKCCHEDQEDEAITVGGMDGCERNEKGNSNHIKTFTFFFLHCN